jgi:hypothetical protein
VVSVAVGYAASLLRLIGWLLLATGIACGRGRNPTLSPKLRVMTARGAASVTGKSARNRIASAQVLPGPSQVWGSGGNGRLRVRIVSRVESLSEAGAERPIVDGAANLQQEIGASSRPAHLL